MGCVQLNGIAGIQVSHLGESLVNEARPIRGVDAFTDTDALGQERDNLAALSRSPIVQLVTADLARGDLYGPPEGVDAVVHLDGEPGVPASSGRAGHASVERNVIVTRRLLEAPVPDAVADSWSFTGGPTPARAGPGRSDALEPVRVGGDEPSRSLR